MTPRHSRQVVLPGFGAEAQARLAKARVLVIGAGGLGSTVIPALAAAGVGTLGVIDDDVVELSNLHRQYIHGVRDVGVAKVRSAAESVAGIDPQVTVIAIEQRFSLDVALELLEEYDLVVDGSDNFETRYLADDAAALTDVPLVWGAVSQYAGQVGVAWASRAPRYRDLFPQAPPADSVLSCAAGGVFPTTVAVIGSLMATEALKILSGVGTPLLGRITMFDGLTGAFRHLDYERDPHADAVELEPALEPDASVSPAYLAEHRSDAVLLDVREPWEAAIASVPNSVLIPLGQLEGALPTLDPGQPVVVYCHHGIRSRSARDLLLAHGFTASHLEGGIDAWARQLDPTMARY